MHAAPPVRIAIGPDRVWSLLSAGLAALAGLSLCSWILALGEAPPAISTPAAALSALLGGALGRRLLVLGQGDLDWDGGNWAWTALGGGVPVQVSPLVAFDLGPWLLLRLVPTSGASTTWVAVSRRTTGALWGSWRAALYSGVAAAAGGARGPES